MNTLQESIYCCLFGDANLFNEVNIQMPNHVTVLSYFSKPQSPEQHLSFHMTTYIAMMVHLMIKEIVRGENTVRAIMTLGDSHEICFREFFSQSCDNQVGKNSDGIALTLTHNSLFVLHSSDKMPFTRR